MKSLTCVIVGDGSVCVVEIDERKKVGILKKMIKEEKPSIVKCEADRLTLYVANNGENWLTSDKDWLPSRDPDVKLLKQKQTPVGISAIMTESREMDPADEIGDVFAGAPTKKVIHVLVKLPEAAPAGDRKAKEPPNKKQRLEGNRISYAGPLHRDDCAVPFDTIDAFRQIKEGLSRKEVIGHPLFLLYGPRQFGKTTIAYRIMDWIASDSNVADVKCVFFEMHESDVAAEGTFWERLGQCIDEESACCDYASFRRLMVECTTHDRTQLCLIVDEMDCLFSNKELAAKFLNALRKWKAAPYFRGFLGIGSHELIHHHEIFRGDDKTSPFNVGDMIKIMPFSVEQMSAFFKLIKPRYSFPQSLQCGIMKYSSGAPGVFGSLIRFTVDNDKWTLEWHEWEPWFKVGAFSGYLTQYNNTYHRIQGDLRSLTELEWEALKYILEDNGSLTASTVEGYCGIAVRGDQQRRLVDPLLRMGIVVQGSSGELAIVSEMMRVCVEALPEREIHQAANTDDPVLLLSVALGQVYPKTISNHLVRNRQAPRESAFHHELYSTIRDILKKGALTRGIYAEVKTPGSRRRADILIANGVRVAYELKSNQLRESEIEAAAKQADEYRQQFSVDRMLVVNFVPIGHTLDEVYRFMRFPRVQIVHARFADSCDQFSLQFLGETNEVTSYSVKCLVR
ncbi:unnamed protein product [Phytophthora lilii]|uniref:Unnamed protein product n=1 Tax=Phytophthora lilii TaxID=2077276 RepID=A0A9W6WNI6_9STRA|nr:unnamed protein product [Phytophthora lilii]